MEMLNLLSARGWFAGFLVIMICIMLLFAVIVFIALKPIKREDIGADITDAKKLLGRREAEVTKELLENAGDKAKTEELMGNLRDIVTAEKIVSEIAGQTADAGKNKEEQQTEKPKKTKKSKEVVKSEKPEKAEKPEKPENTADSEKEKVAEEVAATTDTPEAK